MTTVEHRDSYGNLHCDDGPAVVLADGSKIWYVHGVIHRDGGLPAREYANGVREWWVNGQQHRGGGLPAIDFTDETKNWVREWCVNGELHRDGGLPAIECPNGDKAWFFHGEEIELAPKTGLVYMAFCQRMNEKKRVMAQKKLYFWWIQICYDMDHLSGCGKRMANRNLSSFKELMSQQP